MRIISWNCCFEKNGFTNEKRHEILKLNPDILIVQECRRYDWWKLNYSDKNGHWHSDGKGLWGDINRELGVGIYCNKKYTIERSLLRGKDLSNTRYALPYIIKYQDKEILTLFSVWANPWYENPGSFNDSLKNMNDLIDFFHDGWLSESAKEAKNDYFIRNFDFFLQEWLPVYYKKEHGNFIFLLDEDCFFEDTNDELSFGIGNWKHWNTHSEHMPLIIDINDNFYLKHNSNYVGINNEKSIVPLDASVKHTLLKTPGVEEVIERLKKMKGMGNIDDRKSRLIWSKLQKTSAHYWNMSTPGYSFLGVESENENS
jgi:hypothetical protein